ncbi:hypothetical protein EJ05DRAFT_482651 [Pseudovirgaria hyperparasitica]|uniref:Uncharacterized protein n=1 Tax=Pseudovirgaria hyperparasitica TaxID=470096 RepID=A0A6A6WG61_9PEZI|nr:uncharacterized protein EJ05DRAFT_482651 [Pseudovirgaria hyperparasitica]KAF2761822.1 hypothetical protein EJ05DRAFT_482651 [Pseudovirgaria hyperparasitica]
MSDIDGDSTMHSSPSDVEDMDEEEEELPTAQDAPATPTGGIAPQHPHAFVPPSSEISPPNSQHGPARQNAFTSTSRNDGMPEGSPSAMALNANGKRAIVEGKNEAATKASKPIGRSSSGYEWSRPEDEPGWTWMNRKAAEEYYRAMDQIVDKEYMIKSELSRSSCGDIFLTRSKTNTAMCAKRDNEHRT